MICKLLRLSPALLCAAATVCVLNGCSVNADDWSQWRGNDLRGISEQSAVSDISAEENLLWKVALPGSAGASPVIAGDRIFLTSVDNADNCILKCFGADGEELWQHVFELPSIKSRDAANSASPSPCTDGEHVWATMTTGEMICCTVAGELVWKKNLQKEFGKFHIMFGMSSTPILDNGNLYLQLVHGNVRDRRSSKSQVIALDAKTGKEIWLHMRQTDAVKECKHSYASPCLYRNDVREFLLIHGADYITAHSLVDGKELWRCGGLNLDGQDYNPTFRFVASPSFGEGLIVVPTAKQGGVVCLKDDGEGDITNMNSAYHWKLERGTPDVSSPLVYDGYVYLAGTKGDFSIVDQKTGKVLARERLSADKQRSTPVAADGKIYLVGRKGTVFVLEAGREIKVLSKIALREQTTASPAISNGRVYIRTFKHLYAFGAK